MIKQNLTSWNIYNPSKIEIDEIQYYLKATIENIKLHFYISKNEFDFPVYDIALPVDNSSVISGQFKVNDTYVNPFVGLLETNISKYLTVHGNYYTQTFDNLRLSIKAKQNNNFDYIFTNNSLGVCLPSLVRSSSIEAMEELAGKTIAEGLFDIGSAYNNAHLNLFVYDNVITSPVYVNANAYNTFVASPYSSSITDDIFKDRDTFTNSSSKISDYYGLDIWNRLNSSRT